MMCCAIAALFVAAITALRSVAKKAWTRLPQARWILASFAAVLVLAGGSALMARQMNHAPEHTDFSQYLMQHICEVGTQDGEAALSPGRGNTKR